MRHRPPAYLPTVITRNDSLTGAVSFHRGTFLNRLSDEAVLGRLPTLEGLLCGTAGTVRRASTETFLVDFFSGVFANPVRVVVESFESINNIAKLFLERSFQRNVHHMLLDFVHVVILIVTVFRIGSVNNIRRCRTFL